MKYVAVFAFLIALPIHAESGGYCAAVSESSGAIFDAHQRGAPVEQMIGIAERRFKDEPSEFEFAKKIITDHRAMHVFEGGNDRSVARSLFVQMWGFYCLAFKNRDAIE